jgi:hypothetical protein
MANSSKICPLTKANCDPFDWTNKDAADRNCTFYIESEMDAGRCLYIDAMKAIHKIPEAIKNLKIST